MFLFNNSFRIIKLWLVIVQSMALSGIVLSQDAITRNSSSPPMACWFWGEEEFTPDGYKKYIDRYEKYSSIGIITASLRTQGELTDDKVIRQIQAAANYAREREIGLVMDLDIRLARAEFKKRYPRDLQEIMLLREFSLEDSATSDIAINLPSFSDHYTSGRYPYDPVGVRLERVYSYEKEGDLIKQGSIDDITLRSALASGDKQLKVSVKRAPGYTGRMACAMIAVTINTPDLFSSNLLGFQREVLQLYAGSGLAGAAKDEWGFPGRFHPSSRDLWYSEAMASVYRTYSGHDLIRDMLLMAMGEDGREAERNDAVNLYMRMNYEQNCLVEGDFFDAVKKLFGPTAIVCTHPTWYPYPNNKEIFKNGLSWWNAKRDLAQTDEATPFSIRTALAKKWRSAVWYNMFYDTNQERYKTEIWRAALGGGRLNIHQPYPSSAKDRAYILLKDNLFKAIQRIHLLDYISTVPVNSPVAIIFDHTAVLNWADSSHFADVGLQLADKLWEKGVYADVIPSSEVLNGAITVAANGKIQYGLQQYEAVVYYKPGFDNAFVSSLFERASAFGTTKLFLVDNQVDETMESIFRLLNQRGIATQTQGSMSVLADFPASVVPEASGHIRLIDGTYIAASGKSDVMGDPIKKHFLIDGRKVYVDAIGVVGVRFDKSGMLQALACGGLKSFKACSVEIRLPERLDIALFKENGQWRGIIHGDSREIPVDLVRFTTNWTFVKQPTSMEE